MKGRPLTEEESKIIDKMLDKILASTKNFGTLLDTLSSSVDPRDKDSLDRFIEKYEKEKGNGKV